MEDFNETKDSRPKIEPEFKLHAWSYNGNKWIPLVDLFALLSEVRAEATRLGWETAVLDPIEEQLRKVVKK